MSVYVHSQQNTSSMKIGCTYQPFSCRLIVFISRSTGFVLEGFPSKPDEMRYLAEIGYYPDAAIILQVFLAFSTDTPVDCKGKGVKT